MEFNPNGESRHLLQLRELQSQGVLSRKTIISINLFETSDGLHVLMMGAINRSNESSVVQWKRFKETRLVKVRLLLRRKVGTVKPTHSLGSQVRRLESA
jgi:predicted solute-binding protein